MANEKVVSAKSASRDVGNAAPSARQDCSDVIHISVFFDGTGNNKDEDQASRRWSNPARIWRSARMFADRHGGDVYPIYISGVGTPFNGKPINDQDKVHIQGEDKLLGSGFGGGGSRRLRFGNQQINDALRSALLANAKVLGGKLSQYAAQSKQKSFGDISKALAEHRLIKQINVSIFGFSRGAALARAFCNEWLWQCKEDHGQLSYEGVPIRFVFMGLFDTVASFGIPSTNAANWIIGGGLKGRDLVVDHRVERCVHFVAGHELRFSFPVDLIRRGDKLDGRWLETVYPGVHSDVGGGYQPLKNATGELAANRDNQGLDNNYARIPMRDMMREAGLCGVRLFSYDAIQAASSAVFAEQFECLPATERAHQAYKASCNPAGTIENQMQKHMEQLYGAYGNLYRSGKQSLTQREHAAGQSWALGPKDMATELANFRRALENIDAVAKMPASEAAGGYITAMGLYAMWVEPAQWQLDAWSRGASQAVVSFIDQFVHDSKVGFLGNVEPFSYFSKRGVSESSHSVQGWFTESVAGPFHRGYEAAVDATSRGIEKTVNAAKEAEEAAAKKARELKDAAVKKADEVKATVSEKLDQAERAVVDTAHQVEQAAVEKAQQAKQAAVSAAHSVETAASAAYDKGAQVVKSIGSALSPATRGAADSLNEAWAMWGP